MSTGMARLGEIEAALEVLGEAGTSRDQVTVLHCNTEYPTPMANVNLKAMLAIRDAFGVHVGYSDHTLGIEVPIAAVALGACVIEKTPTLDRGMEVDHRQAWNPVELTAMVSAIRNIEVALGDGRKAPGAEELKNKKMARKSIVAAAHRARAGLRGKPDAKQPGHGIDPMAWDSLLGQEAKRRFNRATSSNCNGSRKAPQMITHRGKDKSYHKKISGNRRNWFLGTELVKHLLERGCVVVGVGRRKRF